MKPPPLRYLRPETIEETLSALSEHGGEAKVLAGGQSLVPALNMRIARPEVLVDINRVPGLSHVGSEKGSLAVGATVRQSDPRLQHPLLEEALPQVGHFVTRNRGTVAGSIAHADPAAELPLCLVALEGAVRARSVRSEREIPASDFFVAPYTTALQPDELVVETRWPARREGWGYAFCEFSQRRGDFALCMAAAAAHETELRVVVGSVAGRPTMLVVDPDRPGESAATQVQPWGGLHATPEYLRHLVRVLVDRAVRLARERAAT